MNLQYKRTNRESYMIMETSQGVSGYEERMLKENDIRALLPFHTMVMNGTVQFWQDISGKQSLRDYLEQEQVSLEFLEKLFISLTIAFEELQKYLIQQQNILLTPDTIYVSRQERFRVYLCFFPAASGAKKEAIFSEMLSHVVDCVDTSKENLSQLCFELYEISMRDQTTLFELRERVRQECEKEAFCTEQIEELVQQIKPRGSEVNNQASGEFYDDDYGDTLDQYDEYDIYGDELDGEAKSSSNLIGDICAALKSKFKGFSFKHKTQKKENSEERVREDFMVDPEPEIIEKTQLLFQNHGARGNLIYQGSFREDNFLIDKDIFRIGHEHDGNEGFLNGNAVSRYHAKISRDGSDFYIEDLNSTNGTYVNGEQLNYTEKILLSPMDKIIFGDVPYLFV